VAGTSVQTYAEDAIAEYIQQTFNELFDKYWIPEYCHTISLTLDGSTGTVTTNLATMTNPLKRITDIRTIFPSGYERQLPRFPFSANPNSVFGTTSPRFWEPYTSTSQDKVFRILPVAAVGDIVMRYRSKPNDFTASSEVLLDSDVLVFGASYRYLEKDGTNPNDTNGELQSYERRINQLLGLDNDAPIPLRPYAGGTLNDWTVA
jgi:hypothetical protein